MTRKLSFLAALLCGISTTLVLSAAGQTTEPGNNAAALYMRAAKIIRDDDAKNIVSPSASNNVFPREYPPLPDNWVQEEKQDYDLHAQVRELFHEAATTDQADWLATNPNKHDPHPLGYLNEIRNLANEIGDAAIYQSVVLGKQMDGFESCEDIFRMTDHLKDQPKETFVQLLVAEGVDALNSAKLKVMIANVRITQDPRDPDDLPLAIANQWIVRLLDHPDAKTEMAPAVKGEAGAAANPIFGPTLARILETTRRCQTERDFAAMSLAAHVYQHKHGRWPANLDELKTELPRVPVDPWGNGKPLGYVLIAGGLPDGSDRPLVYSRCLSKDGLFFKTDEPEYSFYNAPDPNLPPNAQKQGGQFRDVANWSSKPGPTTQALQ